MEVEIALAVCMPDLLGMVAAIEAGREPIPHEPGKIEPVKTLPAPQTQWIFFLRHSKYTGPVGPVLIQRYTAADVPIEVAKRARQRWCVR